MTTTIAYTFARVARANLELAERFPQLLCFAGASTQNLLIEKAPLPAAPRLRSGCWLLCSLNKDLLEGPHPRRPLVPTTFTGESWCECWRTGALCCRPTMPGITGTREQWLAARLALLEEEKELTRRSDELARRRQDLPWVRVDKGYAFETRGRERLARGPLPRALAAPRLPLHVRSRLQGGVSVLLGDRGRLRRLCRAPGEPRRHADRDLEGPLREAASVQAADGVEFPVGLVVLKRLQPGFRRVVHRGTARQGAEYNYRRSPPANEDIFTGKTTASVPETMAAMTGVDLPTYAREAPGVSAFVREHGVVDHTYSSYSRGVDSLWGMYQWLDRAPKGRNERPAPVTSPTTCTTGTEPASLFVLELGIAPRCDGGSAPTHRLATGPRLGAGPTGEELRAAPIHQFEVSRTKVDSQGQGWLPHAGTNAGLPTPACG